MRLASAEPASSVGTRHVGDAEDDPLGRLRRPRRVPAASLAVWKTALEHVAARSRRRLLPRLRPVARLARFRPSAVATSASGVPALSLSRSSVALAVSRLAISSSRQRASTWSLTSSSGRSRDGVMPATSYQTIAAARQLQRVVLDADVGSERRCAARRRRSGSRRSACRPGRGRSGRPRRSCGRRGRASARSRRARCRRRARPRSCRSVSLDLAPWRARSRSRCLICGATSSNGCHLLGLDLASPARSPCRSGP